MSRLRGFAKRAAFRSLRALQVDEILARRLERGGLTAVLGLHRISPNPNPFWPALHPQVFEDLLDYLQKRFQVCTLDQVGDTRGPRIVLTFDDGYYDFVEYAMPILARRGIRAHQNIIPSCVMSGQPPWTVRLTDFLRAAPRSLLREINVRGFDSNLVGDDDDAKARFGVALSAALKTRSIRERATDLQKIEEQMERLGSFRTSRMMSIEDVRSAAAFHEIGVHSYSHESMALESLAFFEDDLAKCSAYFRDQLSLPMRVYAFPNGSYRDEHIPVLERAGIKHILLVEEKLARSGPPTWPRITMAPCSGSHARLQASGLTARGNL